MLVTVFIVKTGKKDADIEKTKGSFTFKKETSVDFIFVPITGFSFINSYPKTTLWYMVIKDTEFMSEELLEAIPFLLNKDEYDFFSFFEKDFKEMVAKFKPRFFKSRVILKNDYLPLIIGVNKFEKILDGYIYKHAESCHIHKA
jgi:predicted nucleotide-binding protein (sugar kinase/HSP70/actin superfamily)